MSSSNWYTGGYRAQTVAYTISLFSHKLKENKMTIDWNSIWNGQIVSESLLKELSRFGRSVHEKLINPPPGNTNIGTYSKKEPCWVRIKSIYLVPAEGTIGIRYIDAEQKDKGKKKGGHPDKGINAQIRVVELASSDMPKKLMNFYNSQYAPGIRDSHKGVLSSWSIGKIAYPSEAQAKIIIQAIKKAENAGM